MHTQLILSRYRLQLGKPPAEIRHSCTGMRQDLSPFPENLFNKIYLVGILTLPNIYILLGSRKFKREAPKIKEARKLK